MLRLRARGAAARLALTACAGQPKLGVDHGRSVGALASPPLPPASQGAPAAGTGSRVDRRAPPARRADGRGDERGRRAAGQQPGVHWG